MNPHPYITSMNREAKPRLKPQTAIVVLLILNVVQFVLFMLTLWDQGVLAKLFL